jgi:hypothetical protein
MFRSRASRHFLGTTTDASLVSRSRRSDAPQPAAVAAALETATLTRVRGTEYVGGLHQTATGKPVGQPFVWADRPPKSYGVMSHWDLTTDGTFVVYYGARDGGDGWGDIETWDTFKGLRTGIAPAVEKGWNVRWPEVSPDGRWLLVVGERNEGGDWPNRRMLYSARILELPSLREVRPTIVLGGDSPSILWTPDGRAVVLVSGELPQGDDPDGPGGQSTVHHVPLGSRGLREGVPELTTARFPVRITSSRLSPDGRYLLAECADGTLHLRRLPRLDGGTSLLGTGPFAFSPDGTRLVTRFGDRGLLHDLTRLSDPPTSPAAERQLLAVRRRRTSRFAFLQAAPFGEAPHWASGPAAGRTLWSNRQECRSRERRGSARTDGCCWVWKRSVNGIAWSRLTATTCERGTRQRAGCSTTPNDPPHHP